MRNCQVITRSNSRYVHRKRYCYKIYSSINTRQGKVHTLGVQLSELSPCDHSCVSSTRIQNQSVNDPLPRHTPCPQPRFRWSPRKVTMILDSSATSEVHLLGSYLHKWNQSQCSLVAGFLHPRWCLCDVSMLSGVGQLAPFCCLKIWSASSHDHLFPHPRVGRNFASF